MDHMLLLSVLNIITIRHSRSCDTQHLSVCLLARLYKKLQADFAETFRES